MPTLTANLIPSQRGNTRRRLERRLKSAGDDPQAWARVLADELVDATGLASGRLGEKAGEWLLLAAQRIAYSHEPEDLPPTAHRWVVAANCRVSEKVAKHAALRGSFRAAEGMRVDALEVSCRMCRRPLDDVIGEPCAAGINNEHLRGGPIGERAKRKKFVPIEGAEVVPGPKINRRGIDAYIRGEV